MTVSAQFLTLYSIALIVVSVVSTVLFMHSYAMQERSLKRYAARMTSLSQRWRTLLAQPGQPGQPAGQGGDAETDPADDAPDTSGADDDSSDLSDRKPRSGTADVIIRNLVAALTPESLTLMADRKPATDDVDSAGPARATATVPSARAEMNPADRPEPAEDQPTPTTAHAPKLQPAMQDFTEIVDLDYVNADYVSPNAEDPETGRPSTTDDKRVQAGRYWNKGYRGRHEAELLIYPTAPFPLVVRNDLDGGSRR
jgi:hypothetical protein